MSNCLQIQVRMVELRGSPARSQNDEPDDADRVMLELYRSYPHASLTEYRGFLCWKGILSTEQMIHQWFQFHFFRLWVFEKLLAEPPRRDIAVDDAVSFLRQLPLHRIKFADETTIKGSRFYNPYKRARCCPFTGTVPATVIPYDFECLYKIKAMCSMDPQSPRAFTFLVHEAGMTKDDELPIHIFVSLSISSGCLREGDVLVIDKPSIRVSKIGKAMPEDFWIRHGVFVLFLPFKVPHLNPLHSLWKLLLDRLKDSPEMYQIFQHHNTCQWAVERYLGGIGPHEVQQAFAACNYSHHRFY